MITLFFTVRQNRKALTEAARQHAESIAVAAQQHREILDDSKDREWRHWQREKLTEYCEEVLNTGQDVIGSLRGCVYWEYKDFTRYFVDQTNKIGTLSNVYRKLELVIGDQLDSAAKRNYNSLANVLEMANNEFKLKKSENYSSRAGLDRIEPACGEATEALRKFALDTRALMGDSDAQLPGLTSDSPPPAPESDPEQPQDG
ncbi:hypothetical protein QSJ18_01845 [Gordonia sp. ABSL1-1]|uniref:hypothetical protein n=1 Tax=Gordonia sp. ABSL1-1 TaxID=3053923 RepID=UPI0025743090|nr:hypothetical protein [Gordonia sp. ABSL1-1]MDL9935479.1 hypothetical protein [Gordonia sp. ABSL1-1]